MSNDIIEIGNEQQPVQTAEQAKIKLLEMSVKETANCVKAMKSMADKYKKDIKEFVKMCDEHTKTVLDGYKTILDEISKMRESDENRTLEQNQYYIEKLCEIGARMENINREFNVTAEKAQKRFDWTTLATGVVSGAAITTFAVVAWKAISGAISKK